MGWLIGVIVCMLCMLCMYYVQRINVECECDKREEKLTPTCKEQEIGGKINEPVISFVKYVKANPKDFELYIGEEQYDSSGNYFQSKQGYLLSDTLNRKVYPFHIVSIVAGSDVIVLLEQGDPFKRGNFFVRIDGKVMLTPSECEYLYNNLYIPWKKKEKLLKVKLERRERRKLTRLYKQEK